MVDNHRIVYHYCSAESFFKIISSKTLRLSELAHTNDPNEIKLSEPIIDALLKENSDILDHENNSFKADNSFFSLSFSCKSDLLSQWRAYAANGSGFMIGVYVEGLKYLNNACVHHDSLQFEYVQYDEANFKSILNERLHKHRGEKSRGCHETFGDLHHSLIFRKFLNEQRCLFKSKFYEEESEVRVFQIVESLRNADEGRTVNTYVEPFYRQHVDFDIRNGKIQPYIGLTLQNETNSCIESVMLGPKNVSLTTDIENFLWKNGFKNIEVTKSSGAYR